MVHWHRFGGRYQRFVRPPQPGPGEPAPLPETRPEPAVLAVGEYRYGLALDDSLIVGHQHQAVSPRRSHQHMVRWISVWRRKSVAFHGYVPRHVSRSDLKSAQRIGDPRSEVVDLAQPPSAVGGLGLKDTYRRNPQLCTRILQPPSHHSTEPLRRSRHPKPNMRVH